ncbi:TPA: hypothetical protein EYP66_09135 [Candidatus Poribacteria bacterium]|nr:hypothetical protein [Candidatus Poribacteria bacterium]
MNIGESILSHLHWEAWLLTLRRLPLSCATTDWALMKDEMNRIYKEHMPGTLIEGNCRGRKAVHRD